MTAIDGQPGTVATKPRRTTFPPLPPTPTRPHQPQPPATDVHNAIVAAVVAEALAELDRRHKAGRWPIAVLIASLVALIIATALALTIA